MCGAYTRYTSHPSDRCRALQGRSVEDHGPTSDAPCYFSASTRVGKGIASHVLPPNTRWRGEPLW